MKLQFSIPGTPRTKKNSQVMVKNRSLILPSQAFRNYERDTAVWWRHQAAVLQKPIDYPVSVKCIYYMPTRRRVDLTNLNESIHDIMVRFRILEDDSRDVIASTDGSRVFYDKENPRVEITISEYKEEYEKWAKR